ncbi:unnamed protein product [Blepharisma stoltei]|uniref:Uncharacterized protein n=1 Tax=Blepharisma stoltei TaxID=1481888 RepID=A0AAU9JJG3_9CILI|nr:unnamed protein product [Blepharisma stoltei]
MSEERLCKHEGPCWENAFKGFIKAFLQSLAAKSMISLIFNFILEKGYKHPMKSLMKIFSIDTLRFVGFASFMNILYKGTLCILRHYRKKEDSFNYFVSGCVSGLSVFVEDPGRRETWALYFFARFVDIVLRVNGKKYNIDINRVEVGIFMITVCFMVYCYGAEKDNMLKSYYNFLDLLFQPSRIEKFCLNLWSKQNAEKMPLK